MAFMYQLIKNVTTCYFKNSYIKYTVDLLLHIQNTIYIICSFRAIEPNINDWYSISSLHHYKNYRLQEIYKFNSKKYLYNLFYNYSLYKTVNYIEVDDCLFIIKNKFAQYIVKNTKANNFNEQITLPSTNIIFDKSNVFFLTIQYFQNNDMNEIPITLDIPKTMYIVDNELLSPTFIYRCLKYQGYSSKFNMSYKIKLIDHEINMIELNYSQYIILKKNNYVII